MSWTMLILGFLVVKAAVLSVFAWLFYLYVRRRFMPMLTRVFQEKPLFVVPRGEPDDHAEDVRFATADGLMLRGCYLHSKLPDRRGVILFGLEFGSNRWAATQYCNRLRDAGYDVFAFEPRNQGESDSQADYKPLQWATDRDLRDTEAALNYLSARPDADPKGVGLFGVSKGGSVGLVAAANDPRVNCVVTDGAFGTHTTVLPYIYKWASIYSPHERIRKMLPEAFYRRIVHDTIRSVAAERNVQYLKVEQGVEKLKRPLLMIHGGGDSYIKPEMAKSLCDMAKPGTAELWMVEKAKHNQAIHVAGDEYHAKVIQFFDRHLAGVGVTS